MRRTDTLLLSSCYIRDQQRCHLLRLWNGLRERLSPEFDALMIDQASPFGLRSALPDWTAEWIDDDDAVPVPLSGRHVATFRPQPDVPYPPSWAKGHPDPALRAILKGIAMAEAAGYDSVMYVEADTLLARPLGPIVDKLRRRQIKVATPWNTLYHWCETEIAWFDLAYLREIDFARRYNWRAPAHEFYERQIELMMGDELFLLPLRGARNDLGQITAGNIRKGFPFGCDYMTHCADFGVYRAFLAMNGMEDLWDE
jgi:hypothetical protein